MHCDCFILPLLLPTPTLWFSLDHKRNVSDGVVNGIGTLFSLDLEVYASGYESDSVASENQPLAPSVASFPALLSVSIFHFPVSRARSPLPVPPL